MSSLYLNTTSINYLSDPHISLDLLFITTLAYKFLFDLIEIFCCKPFIQIKIPMFFADFISS